MKGIARLFFAVSICLLPALFSSCQEQINYPQPDVASLSPASGQAGQPAFTLTVNGSHFTPASTVLWNGAGRVTIFQTINQLTAQILASDIQNAGSATVAVETPQPGGGVSQNPLTFTINPAPSLIPQITSLSPSGVSAGSGSFALSVTGTNFVSLATVTVNGSARQTDFSNSTLLEALIPASDVATAGTLEIAVVNPSPGGGSSGAYPFNVKNLVPTVSGVSPTAILAGSASSTVAVSGTGYVLNSVVTINGSPRATTFSSSGGVTALLTAGDVAAAGVLQVQVVNPAPGGGTSNTSTIAVNGTELMGLPLLVDLGPDGVQANNGICGVTCTGGIPTLTTAGPSESGTGEFVAFASNSTNLVTGPVNTSSEIFVRDTCLSSVLTIGGTSSCLPATYLQTQSANGGSADGPSDEPSIDGGASHVAYTSTASNLVTYVSVPGGSRQVYWQPVCTTNCATASSLPALVSASVDGLSVGNGESYNPVISPDGEFVAFVSLATNLVASPIADGITPQVYLRDTCSVVPPAAPSGTCTPTTYMVSEGADGVSVGNAPSLHPAIASQGLFVSFVSSATNLVTAPSQTGASEVFERSTCATTIGTAGNACAPATTLISTPDGVSPADGTSIEPAMSTDGRLVAFASTATTLVNGVGPTQEVYVRDTCTGFIGTCTPSNQLVSTPNGTTPANALSENPSVNGCSSTTVSTIPCITGQFIAFASYGTNFGTTVANGVENVYVRDACTILPSTVISSTTTATPCSPYTILASQRAGTSPPPADGSSLVPSIGGDGQTVSFISFADNLVARDTNGFEDIFLAPASLIFNFTLTLPGSGSGTVTDSTGQISCTDTLGVQSGTCTAQYISGSTITLTATPTVGGGSVFVTWGGSVIGTDCLVNEDEPCEFSVGQNTTATATFH